jgi:hypothetical protein
VQHATHGPRCLAPHHVLKRWGQHACLTSAQCAPFTSAHTDVVCVCCRRERYAARRRALVAEAGLTDPLLFSSGSLSNSSFSEHSSPTSSQDFEAEPGSRDKSSCREPVPPSSTGSQVQSSDSRSTNLSPVQHKECLQLVSSSLSSADGSTSKCSPCSASSEWTSRSEFNRQIQS